MNKETNEDISYLSCDINGTRYICKIASTDIIKDMTSNKEQNIVNMINMDTVKETDLEKEEEEPISLVCLNGQVYAFQNGIFQELDTNQIIEQADCHEKTLLVTRDMENCGNEYLSNENIVIESAYEHSEEQYESITEETEKDVVMEDDNVNVDDFVEVVTAFKCKICTYMTQDKIQLLNHIQKVHLSSTVDIEVSSNLDLNHSLDF